MAVCTNCWINSGVAGGGLRLWRYCATDCDFFQYEAALAIDSARLIFQALDNASTALRPTTRNGTFAWSRGVDCDAEPVVPFEYGTEIMEALRNVSFTNKNSN